MPAERGTEGVREFETDDRHLGQGVTLNLALEAGEGSYPHCAPVIHNDLQYGTTVRFNSTEDFGQV
jgi:hypothetical protein